MRALLIVAHGSRRHDSNDEVRQLTDRIRSANQEFDVIDCAFLELAAPSIPDGIAGCIAQGASQVVVLPYFLSAGRHVVEDIPALVEQSRQQHPDAAISIAPYLGTAGDLPATMLNLVKS